MFLFEYPHMYIYIYIYVVFFPGLFDLRGVYCTIKSGSEIICLWILSLWTGRRTRFKVLYECVYIYIYMYI